MSSVRSGESARLRERGAAAWAAAVNHPMVVEIGQGTLPHETFRFYFEQNISYLEGYLRAIAYTVAEAPDRACQATLVRFLSQIVEVEIPANIDFLTRLGGSADTVAPLLGTTRDYIEHVVSCARSGSLAVALAGLLPCQWSYGEIGRLLLRHVPQDPVYADWIAMFASDGYDDLVQASTALLDDCAADADHDAVEAAFDRSTRLELAFWQMAYTRGTS